MSNQLSPFSDALLKAWLQALPDSRANDEVPACSKKDASVLISQSQLLRFTLGTGTSLLSTFILPICAEATKHELLFVTCFWASSPSLHSMRSLLISLSERGRSLGRRIRVRIGFCSFSLRQKLTQTNSMDGKIWPPSSWHQLGLASQEDMPGVDLQIKSVFVKPISFMHSKFIIVDRKRAWMPSCNVSWEDWFEGCVEVRGDVVKNVVDFYEEAWGKGGGPLPPIPREESLASTVSTESPSKSLLADLSLPTSGPITTVLLPSSHHSKARFRPWPLAPHPPPPTPLNTFLLQALSSAKSSIFIQSPNFTCCAVINSIFSTLERGVEATLITSRKQQLLEQFLSSGTITPFEMWKFRRRWKKLVRGYERMKERDPESLPRKPGVLKVGWFTPLAEKSGEEEEEVREPVKSHLKLTIVDDEVVVLGSGNMDRASWYTSQELGITFLDHEMASSVKGTVLEALEKRVEYQR